MPRLPPSVAVWLVVCLLLPGCSAYLAASKPPRKDLGMLAMGTPRRVVVGELGLPEESAHGDDGHPIDVWSFAQGDSKWVKVPKVIMYIALDVFTLGLFEILGTPTEILLEQDELTYVVAYDDANRVRAVTVLGKRGAIEQTGYVGSIAAVPLAASAVGSRHTPDLDRQAMLAAIAQRHGMVVTYLRYRPSGRATVSAASTTTDDQQRVVAFAQDLCTADTGLVVTRRASDPAPRFRLEQATHVDGRTDVHFRCSR